MPKLDLAAAAEKTDCAYPAPYDRHCRGRAKKALGDLGGLSQFGVNLTRLAPGAASAHRHWHKNEDEFIYLLKGEAVLVEDDGETILHAGDAAAFKAGVENGHMLVNRSPEEVLFLEVGTRAEEDVSTYTDVTVDMRYEKRRGAEGRIVRRNGENY